MNTIARNAFRSSRSFPRSLVCLQRRLLSQESQAQIQTAINSKPVVLFMKGTPETPQCGFSRAVVLALDNLRVPSEKMQTYDVLEDPILRNDIKEFSEWPTVPQVYIAGEFIGGCDIIRGMHQSGELQALLEQHNITPKTSEKELAAS